MDGAGFHSGKKRKVKDSVGWMIHNSDAHQWFIGTTGMDFKNSNRSNTSGRSVPFLKNSRRSWSQWGPSSKRSEPKHETGDGLSFMEHVGFPRKRFWQQPLANWSSSNPAAPQLCCYCVGVIMTAVCKLLSVINTAVKSCVRTRFEIWFV